MTVELSRRDSGATLRVEKDGFMPKEGSIRRSPSRWLLADVAFAVIGGSVPGGGDAGAPAPRIALGLLWTLGAEYLTGAAFRLPESINVKLTRASAGTDQKDRAAETRQQDPEVWRAESGAPRVRGGREPQRD